MILGIVWPCVEFISIIVRDMTTGVPVAWIIRTNLAHVDFSFCVGFLTGPVAIFHNNCFLTQKLVTFDDSWFHNFFLFVPVSGRLNFN